MHSHFNRVTIFPRIYDKTESMLQFRSHVFRSVAGGISFLLVQERRTMLGGEHGMRKGREKNSTIPLFSSPGRRERWEKDGGGCGAREEDNFFSIATIIAIHLGHNKTQKGTERTELGRDSPIKEKKMYFFSFLEYSRPSLDSARDKRIKIGEFFSRPPRNVCS